VIQPLLVSEASRHHISRVSASQSGPAWTTGHPITIHPYVRSDPPDVDAAPQRAKATADVARIGVDMLDRIVAAPEVRLLQRRSPGKLSP